MRALTLVIGLLVAACSTYPGIDYPAPSAGTPVAEFQNACRAAGAELNGIGWVSDGGAIGCGDDTTGWTQCWERDELALRSITPG